MINTRVLQKTSPWFGSDPNHVDFLMKLKQLVLLLVMSAELLALGGLNLVGKQCLALRGEPDIQRGGQDRSRHTLFDGGD